MEGEGKTPEGKKGGFARFHETAKHEGTKGCVGKKTRQRWKKSEKAQEKKKKRKKEAREVR